MTFQYWFLLPIAVGIDSGLAWVSIADVMEEAAVELVYLAEIQDIVDELARLGVIDFV